MVSAPTPASIRCAQIRNPRDGARLDRPPGGNQALVEEREKLVWNQQVFARANESIRDLATDAAISGPVQFLCECSDVDCRAEIAMSVGEYRRAHARAKSFVVVTGHELPAIERVVESRRGYVVVEKVDELIVLEHGREV